MSARPLPPAGFLDRFPWTDDDVAFGGISGIEMSANGLSLVALTDQGRLFEALLTRDQEGRIVAIEAGPSRPLPEPEGGSPVNSFPDSEGLDLGPNGQMHVSFEGRVARVLRLDRRGEGATALPRADEFAVLPKNASLEALAVDGAGTVFVIPEGMAGARSVPVFRLLSGRWDKSLTLERHGRFLPVAADFGPDGRLYVLERDFMLAGGFASRLRRFEIAPEGLANETVLFQTPSGLHDNLEGLSIWRDAQGRLRATLASDDNFLFLQSSELVEYWLPD